ncbi:GLPGLI family protein [Chryseobacterium indoltheticum]|uniref:GLPGLI family protein n=1 Tax=Chryseobacterium indoltheticum TaxID=254 RepID=A0A381FGP7_9FLAO|nr:GLPGLI family protein [Chryseobacterium indoltheticum]SUX45710.1 GLPGLI family protein [Chryseobacterium indoltheticum]
MKELISMMFLLSCFLSKAQNNVGGATTNIVCRYQVQFLKDTLNVESKTNEIMALQIGGNISLYKSEQKRKTDSLRHESIKNSMQNAQDKKSVVIDFSKISKVNLVHEVYKNGDDLVIFDNIIKDQYFYPANKKIDWKINVETKQIAGYTCQKATGQYNNRFYTAWFTKEIPISEGPYTFKGLPGLILEVYDTNKYFFISLISIQRLNEEIIPMNRAIKTTYNDFKKKRREVNDNPIAELQKLSNNPISKEVKDKVIENRKRKNNYLD